MDNTDSGAKWVCGAEIHELAGGGYTVSVQGRDGLSDAEIAKIIKLVMNHIEKNPQESNTGTKDEDNE